MTTSNIQFVAAANVASTANVAGTFSGTNAGPGDTITSTTGAPLVIDGHTVVLNDRVLLKNQTAGLQNGVYACTQAPVAGQVATLTTIVQPTGGTLKNGTYQGVALTGGTGTGATAIVQVTAGVVAYVAIQNPGVGYTVADVLTYNANGQGFGNGGTITVVTVTTGTQAGAILTTNTLTQPTTDKVWNGYYWNFPLTGGTGTGATANITIAAGVVTSIVLVTAGSGYTAADVLHFNGTVGTSTEGLGTGGTVVAATITFTSSVLTRTADASFAKQVEALGVWVLAGTAGANTSWVQTQLTVTMDTTALTFVQLV